MPLATAVPSRKTVGHAFLLVVLCLASCSLTTASVRQHRSRCLSDDDCSSIEPQQSLAASLSPIAGLAFAGRGVNTISGAFRLMSLINYTYDYGLSWTSPVSPYRTYAVPDQLSVASERGMHTDVASKLGASAEYAKDKYYSKTHISTAMNTTKKGDTKLSGNFTGSVNGTGEISQINFKLQAGFYKFGFSQFRSHDYKLVTWPAYALPLSDEFTAAVRALPPTASSANDRFEYQSFLERVGTHYVCSGTFGGAIDQVTFVDMILSIGYSSSQCIAQITKEFHQNFHNVSGGANASASDYDLDIWFINASSKVEFWRGGNSSLWFESKTVGDWMKTVPDNATLVESVLCPIPELMADYPEQQASYVQFLIELISEL